MSGQPTNAKRRKGRSPSYPAIDLETAIGRARAFYEQEKRHAAPVATALQHWGYTVKSSPGQVTLAALKKYGLLVDEGSGEGRKVRLSAAAIRILLDTEGSTERRDAIREAALKPTIHAELWDRYDGSLPSDGNMRSYLLIERGFTETAVDDLIANYKRTLAHAGLHGSGSIPDEGEEKISPEGESEDDPMSAAAPPVTSDHEGQPESRDFQFTVTLYGGRLATVKAPVPMTKRNLERLQRMIADQLEPFVDSDDPEA